MEPGLGKNNNDGRLLVDNYPQMSISKSRAAKWSYLCGDEIQSIYTLAYATQNQDNFW